MKFRLLHVAALALVCCELAVADESADEDFKNLKNLKHDKMDRSLRLFDGLRGIWIGFNRGLYKDAPRSEMEKECLNNKVRARWQETYSVWLGAEDLDEDIDELTAIGGLFQVIANLDSCDIRRPFRDMVEFCSQE